MIIDSNIYIWPQKPFNFQAVFCVVGCRQSSVKQSSPAGCLAEKLVVWLTSEGFMLKDLESVPFGVALPIRDAIVQCREHPCSDWSEEVCALIGRQDLTKQAHKVSLAKGKP
ncbi:anaphase-promoting complex subunit 1 isoform X1, partial [Tachysurus ichikawai]